MKETGLRQCADQNSMAIFERQRLGTNRIISADNDFDRLEDITRLDHARIGECGSSILTVRE